MAKFDVKAAYRNIHIHTKDDYLLGFRALNRFRSAVRSYPTATLDTCGPIRKRGLVVTWNLSVIQWDVAMYISPVPVHLWFLVFVRLLCTTLAVLG